MVDPDGQWAWLATIWAGIKAAAKAVWFAICHPIQTLQKLWGLIKWVGRQLASGIKRIGNKINHIYQTVRGRVKVGQWMSPEEYAKFVKDGLIPRSHVLTKGMEGWMKQANIKDFYVEFYVKKSLLKVTNQQLGWSLVKSMNKYYVINAIKKGLKLAKPIGYSIKHVFTKLI